MAQRSKTNWRGKAYDVLEPRLPAGVYPWMRNRFRRLLIARDGMVRTSRHVVRRGRRPAHGPRVLFYPDLPSDASAIYQTVVPHGWRITNSPSGRFDLVFRWRDATRWPNDAVLERLARSHPVVNLRCEDISKSRVAEVHQQVFGYNAELDPITHVGRCVRKSEHNARHDGRILQCPTPAEPGYIYQQLIDTEMTPGVVTELRVPVVGSRLPFVWVQQRSIDLRFRSERTTHTEVMPSDEVLSAEEITAVTAFCAAFGLDYGELDVLRDRRDGRIHIIDVNSTPFAFPDMKLWGGQDTIDRLEAALRQLAEHPAEVGRRLQDPVPS